MFRINNGLFHLEYGFEAYIGFLNKREYDGCMCVHIKSGY